MLEIKINIMRIKQFIFPALTVLMFSFIFSSCKKEKGVCYCKYANGNKLEFDLNTVPSRDKQEDSCAYISHNASFYGGSCKLK